jgi:hypothetical protein
VGILQPHAGHGGGHGAALTDAGTPKNPFLALDLAAPAVVVYGLDQARHVLRAAAAAGRPVVVASPPGAAAYWGPMYFQEVMARAAQGASGAVFTAVLDCGDRPGDVLAALRQGLRCVVFRGRDDVARQLGSIAGPLGARLLPDLAPAIDLRNVDDVATALRNCFAGLSKS